MNKEILIFADADFDKHNFLYHKNTIMIDGIDIDKILISNSSMKWISLGQLYKKKKCFKNRPGTTL